MNFRDYMNDGVDKQSRAVLCYLYSADINELANRNTNCTLELNRWSNGREQGYVVSLRIIPSSEQINIAFFEHRNSDNIHAVKWEQLSWNPITIDTAEFGESVYKDKFDTSFHVNYGEVTKMAEWIDNELVDFLETHN